ncbi:MAG: hypothetical protein ACRBF0_08325 [Calditrichia bacterium]
MAMPRQMKWYILILTHFILFWLFFSNFRELLTTWQTWSIGEILTSAAVLSSVILIILAPSIQAEILESMPGKARRERIALTTFFYISRFFPLFLGVSMLLFTIFSAQNLQREKTREIRNVVSSVEYQNYRNRRIVNTNIYIRLNGDSRRYDVVGNLMTTENRERFRKEISAGDSLYIVVAIGEATTFPTERFTVLSLSSPLHGHYFTYSDNQAGRSGSTAFTGILFMLFTLMAFIYTTGGGRFWETPAVVSKRKK